ncbi:MAG: GNAT family N-acetyltransferase [Clostridia bacterium]|nr:GNAT family N-acetyltransferase [Clostridia bacterium]
MSLKDYLVDKPTLETERLLLRPLTADDAPDLEKWLPDPELYTYWGRPANNGELHPHTLFIDPRPHVKRKPSPNFAWGIVWKPTGEVIGQMYVIEIENNRMAKVAYRLSRQYWGQGITTEALHRTAEFCFENTELQRLWTDVDIRNTASYKVLEKCGFIREGFIRQGKMSLTFCDYYIYGMLREDFQKN